jgi:hypothetical protein
MAGESAFTRTRKSGEGPAETQDDVRTSFSGRHITARWWGGRGTGAVKATGSYEGSLSVEDSSGCHEPSPFTRRWSRRPWRLPHAGKRYGSRGPKLKETRRRLRHPTEEGEATEESEARSVCWRRGKKTPTLAAHVCGRKTVRRAKRQDGSACPAAIRRSVLECRETLGPPVIHTEPKTPWGVHAMKVA